MTSKMTSRGPEICTSTLEKTEEIVKFAVLDMLKGKNDSQIYI